VGSHRGAFAFVLLAALSSSPWPARAASLSQTGTDGQPGAPGAPPPDVDQTGGAGESILVQVTPPLTDLDNSATAIGGNGGRGGDGNLSDGYGGAYSGYGGNGGAGGTASALAATNAASGDTSATSNAMGGNGGEGGNDGGTGFALNGQGGAGANATATSSAATLAGAASASANAQGGVGGGPGQVYPPNTDDIEAGPPGTGGAAGQASADATASATTSATATAKAIGGLAGYGGNSSPAQDGGAAAAHATATSSGSGDAMASADAEAGGGIGYPSGGGGGVATATASASSVGGNASATARQVAGYGGGGRIRGPRVSDGVIPGLPGTSSSMTDAVSGSAAGQLSLVQQAIAGDGAPSANGGSGQSVLHATNPGGGELSAEVLAQGGSTAQDYGSLAPTIYSSGRGGGADAEVYATVANAKRIEAHAVAQTGYGFLDQWNGGTNGSGNATAIASAQGLGEVVAHATASGPAASHYLSQADAFSAAPVLGAHVVTNLTLPTAPGSNTGPGPDPFSQQMRTADTTASILSSAGSSSPGLPASGSGIRQSSLYAAPSNADLAAWIGSGLGVGEVPLALASFAADGEANDQAHISSSFELDLDGGTFRPGTLLGFTFYDAASLGDSVQLLHLQMNVEGRTFDTVYTGTAEAVSALSTTNSLIPLIENDPTQEVSLTFDLDFNHNGAENAFVSNFLIWAAPVPEPTMPASIGLLALALVLGKLANPQARSEAQPSEVP